MTIWDHLLPPFDAWWPNIIAAIVWATPAFAAHHLLLRRSHQRALDEQSARLAGQVRSALVNVEKALSGHKEVAAALHRDVQAGLADITARIPTPPATAEPPTPTADGSVRKPVRRRTPT